MEYDNLSQSLFPKLMYFVKAQKYIISANYCQLFLLRIINAAMTPGTQPQSVRRNTMSIEPQPRSITASGGKIMARIAWRKDIELL